MSKPKDKTNTTTAYAADVFGIAPCRVYPLAKRKDSLLVRAKVYGTAVEWEWWSVEAEAKRLGKGGHDG